MKAQKGFSVALVLVGALILAVLGGAYYLQSKEALLHFGKFPSPKPSSAQCKTCVGPWDTCSGGFTCVVPEGSSQGLCLPVLKMGQDYTINQINNRCGTNFSGNTLANWKTYTSQNDGYTLRYPQDWNYKQNNPWQVGDIDFSSTKNSQQLFHISVNNDSGSLDTIAKDLGNKGKVSDIIIDGVTGKSVSFVLPSPLGNGNNKFPPLDLLPNCFS